MQNPLLIFLDKHWTIEQFPLTIGMHPKWRAYRIQLLQCFLTVTIGKGLTYITGQTNKCRRFNSRADIIQEQAPYWISRHCGIHHAN